MSGIECVAPVWVGTRHIEAVGAPGSDIRLPRFSGIPKAVPHKIVGKQRSRIFRPVPIMQREQWVHLTNQFFKMVDNFAMPGKKFRAAMHVRCLVYLVLLEPPAYAAGRRVGFGAWIVAA